jgi:hypothetical protein
MQIDGEGVENMFINMMLQKRLQKYTYEKTLFHGIWEWAKEILSYNLV